MSGGVAYVFDEDGTFAARCNTEHGRAGRDLKDDGRDCTSSTR